MVVVVLCCKWVLHRGGRPSCSLVHVDVNHLSPDLRLKDEEEIVCVFIGNAWMARAICQTSSRPRALQMLIAVRLSVVYLQSQKNCDGIGERLSHAESRPTLR